MAIFFILNYSGKYIDMKLKEHENKILLISYYSNRCKIINFCLGLQPVYQIDNVGVEGLIYTCSLLKWVGVTKVLKNRTNLGMQGCDPFSTDFHIDIGISYKLKC